jgi:hypothetical protein
MRQRVRTALGTLIEGELLPFISLLVVTAAALTVGLDYEMVVNGIRLAFYAVLVAVWTSISPTEPLEDGGNYAQFEFLMLCTAALLVGFGVEHVLTLAAGSLYAIQAVGLIAVVSRLYVNSVGTSTLEGVLRLHSSSDRYLVYVPSALAMATPILWYRAGVEQVAGYALGSPQAFVLVGTASLAAGGLAYLVVDQWLLERVFDDSGGNRQWNHSTDSISSGNRVGAGEEEPQRESPEHGH